MKRNTYITLLVLFGAILFSNSAIGQEKKKLKSDEEALFEVKNDEGKTVFAVYPGGVKIFIDDQAKATGAGFTVGRLSTGKATESPIFTVQPNDVKVTIDDQAKATGAGFTVGRLSTGKATESPIFTVKPNDVKVTIDDQAKATGAGFTVGRLSTGKATESPILTVQPNDVKVTIDDQAKATGAGFTVGRLSTGKATEKPIFTVKKNKVKVLIDENATSTGKDFGFTVTSLESDTSANIPNFLSVTADSTRVYAKEGAGNVAAFSYATIDTSSNTQEEPILNLTNLNYFIGHGIASPLVDLDVPQTVGPVRFNYIAGFGAAHKLEQGADNLIIGYAAVPDATTMNNNVILGNHAGETMPNGNNNILIGLGAGRHLKDSLNNQLCIGVQTITANGITPPLIEGNFSEQTVHINGTLSADNFQLKKSLIVDNLSVSDSAVIARKLQTPWVLADSMNIKNNVFVEGRLNANQFYTTGSIKATSGVFDNLMLANPLSINSLLVTDSAKITGKLDADNIQAGYGNFTASLHASQASVTGILNSNQVVIKGGATEIAITPNTSLDVKGDAVIEGEATISGDLRVNGQTINPSDQRLKTDLVPITEGLNMVKSLVGYYYNWKDDAKSKFGFTDKHQVGLMAQEVEKVLPEAVVDNPANGYKAIAYNKLIPVLLSAIKEQNEIIENLKTDFEEYKASH